MTRLCPTRLSIVGALLVLAPFGCGDAPDAESTTGPTETPPTARAVFEIRGEILGPVQQDNASDMLFTLRETAGVGAVLHWVRLECTNRSTQEWGAESFVAEFGTNHVDGSSTFVFKRAYICAVSGRPATITASMTDDSGNDLLVTGSAFHPDWPGS